MTAIAGGLGLNSAATGFRIRQSNSSTIPTNLTGLAVRPDFSRQMSDVPSSWPSGVDDVSQVSGAWFIGQCKPMEEKKFAHDLAHLGIDYYLPLVTRVSRAGGKAHDVWQPLMAGYVPFAGPVGPQGECEERHLAIKTAHLIRVIDVHKSERAKFIDQLGWIQSRVNFNPRLGEEQPIGPGKRCLVLPGHDLVNFEGMCYSVDNQPDKVLVYLKIDLLGQSLPVAVDSRYIRLLD